MKKIGLFLALAIAGALAFAAVKWYSNKNADVNAKQQTELKKEEQKEEFVQTNETAQTVQDSPSDQTTQNQSGFNFRFLDEGTGMAVRPDKVEIKKKSDGKSFTQITKEQIDPSGTTSIKLPNASYNISVSAQGYEPMSSFFTLDNQILDVNFNLVPLNPKKELSSAYIQSFHRQDAMVIVGFVVDDAAGKPLDNVEIYSADKKSKTFSKSNGFFQLILPLAEKENAVEDRGTLFFEKGNYTTEVRQNFDMYPNGDIILQIRMNRGSGINKTDILQTRKANREILN